MGEKQSINTGVPGSVNDMEAQRMMVQSGHMTTEGDLLYYEVRGEGQPLLMIPGGGGDGDRILSLRIFCRMNSKSLPMNVVPMHAVQ
jgi:hypothetical protein